MKIFSAGTLLIGKFLLLACFTFMNFAGGNAEAATPAPCHQKEIEKQMPLSGEDCHACELSAETWEKKFVYGENNLLETLKNAHIIFTDTFQEFFLSHKSFVLFEWKPPDRFFSVPVSIHIPSTVLIV
ncbi:hypothetical protein K9M59_04375 [Candidatus Gracilibacteria bacterium]|nr:hypothetical protein [Candidatus Gracilibacteria bacterium]MCF7819555.1 hypothetical protein [Candidatus Gracilibacteria bacterium]